MSIEDKLPKAEDVFRKHFLIDDAGFLEGAAHVELITEAMHEYARRLLDVAAESAETKTIWHSDIANEVDQVIVDKQSILKLKEMLK